VGGWIGQMTGMYPEGSPVGFLMATLGAVVVLFIFSMVSSKRS
jgi:uncharacterized membrane protein YeaQ/YmgE (transglycosylase-associated protein family)